MARFSARRSPFGLSSTIIVAVGFLVTGCSGDGGLSHRERAELARKDAAAALTALGGSAEEKQYPQGTAWVIGLPGGEISDEAIGLILSFDQIAELNLQGSTLTDENLKELAASDVLGTLFKLDIGDTPVTDSGLLALVPLRLLGQLNVKGTKVTKAGISALEEQRLPHPLKIKLQIQR